MSFEKPKDVEHATGVVEDPITCEKCGYAYRVRVVAGRNPPETGCPCCTLDIPSDLADVDL